MARNGMAGAAADLRGMNGLQIMEATVSGAMIRAEDALYRRPQAERLGYLAGLLKENFTGSYRQRSMAKIVLREVMTRSDFPNLFGTVIDRMLLANYKARKPDWELYCRRGSVQDFRAKEAYVLNGAATPLDVVAELAAYPQGSLSDGKYPYSLAKRGRVLTLSWEAIINDDLDAFMQLPEQLAKAAWRTEQKFAADLFFDANGPDATFFSNGNSNLINTTNGAASNNPVLGYAGLKDAVTVLARQEDTDGNPIVIEGLTLVIPQALQVDAMELLEAKEIWLNEQPGSTTARILTGNWTKGRFKIAVNDQIPAIVTGTPANAHTSWLLVADPREGRPAAEVGFLRGNEAPDFRVNNQTGVRMGGGDISPQDGSFDADSIAYRVRHVMGGTLMDPRMAVASNGSAS